MTVSLPARLQRSPGRTASDRTSTASRSTAGRTASTAAAGAPSKFLPDRPKESIPS